MVARYRREFTPRLLPAWKRWLARNHSANWATTDAICGLLIGPLLAAHPELAPQVRALGAAIATCGSAAPSIVGLIPSCGEAPRSTSCTELRARCTPTTRI